MKKSSRLKLLCAIFLAVDVVVAAALGLTIWKNQRENTSRRDALAQQMGVTREMDEAAREELFAQAVGAAHRNVSLHSEAEAENGRIAIWLSNDEENACAVELELISLANGKAIAQTDLVFPGWHVESVQMDEALPPGEHFCLAKLHFYMASGNDYLGTAARQVLITVK